jgi:asparagine synthase (glutamine-hydrolysing)
VDKQRIHEMCNAMIHRGPDEDGIHCQGNVGLGMRRLSIIDLSTGRQPIHNEDQTVWVMLNGEIYNYRELRDELRGKGHRFYTDSDTEVLVHLYEEYGDEFVEHLSGMFGFALFDTARDRILIGRDRIGEKQIYYCQAGDALVFGSEIKCLFASGLVDREIDPVAVDEYLRYLYIPAPRTIFRNIRELPAASMMIIEGGVKSRIVNYWRLEVRPPSVRNENEAVEAVSEQLERSVASRMVSDVPIGALLSGGIDSSAVVAGMVAAASQPVKTYTIGYEGDQSVYDERADARKIAKHLGTDHHEIVIKPDIEDVIPRLVRAFDQPFADSSAVANYYVFQETSKHVKVVLSGLGGDELLGGYERHLAIRRHAGLAWLPRWMSAGALPWLTGLLPEPRSGARQIDRVKRFARGMAAPAPAAYEAYLTAFDADTRGELLREGVRSEVAAANSEPVYAKLFETFDSEDPVGSATCVDVLSYLPGDLLTLTDRMSMQHSIEARAPLIDHDFVELALSIPSALRIRGAEKKRILRQVVRNRIPPEILDRPKRGFTIPVTNWFRDELQGYLRSVLATERVAKTGLFNTNVVERLIQEHVDRRHNHHARLWALVTFMVWNDEYKVV